MINICRQKRLIEFVDAGNTNDVMIYSADIQGAIDATLYPLARFNLTYTHKRSRRYVWYDDFGVYHSSGTASNPVHNLGFLQASDSPPARKAWSYELDYIIPPDLRYVDGDILKFSMWGGTKLITFFAQIVEEFLPADKQLPRWRTRIQCNPIFRGTEGGEGIPAALQVGNYQPVNTSKFVHSLSANENNVQAALDALDKHSITFKLSQYEFIRFLNVSTFPFSATINGAPAGAVVNYNVPTAGSDNELRQYDANGAQASTNLAKVVLFNSTRGNYALISDCNVGARQITLDRQRSCRLGQRRHHHHQQRCRLPTAVRGDTRYRRHSPGRNLPATVRTDERHRRHHHRMVRKGRMVDCLGDHRRRQQQCSRQRNHRRRRPWPQQSTHPVGATLSRRCDGVHAATPLRLPVARTRRAGRPAPLPSEGWGLALAHEKREPGRSPGSRLASAGTTSSRACS